MKTDTIYSGLVQKVFKTGKVLVKVGGKVVIVRAIPSAVTLKANTTVALSKHHNESFYLLGRT